MTDAAGHPWWKRKRWITAAALWLLVAYPLSTGPIVYAAHRGWIPTNAYYVYCWLRMRAFNNNVGAALGYWTWIGWWEALAARPEPD